MTYCYNAVRHFVFLDHHVGHRFTHNIAPPHNDKVFAFKIFHMPANKYLAAVWSTGKKTFIISNKFPHIDRMESIHIFNRINGVYYSFFINLFRQRKLYKYTIHITVVVELIYQLKQFTLCCAAWEYMLERVHANFLAPFPLHPYIHRRGSIITNKYNCKSGNFTINFIKLNNPLFYFSPYFRAYFFTVYYFCHLYSPLS